MEFYDARPGGVLPAVERAEFQKGNGYIVQDETIWCALLPPEGTRGKSLQKYAAEELGLQGDPRVWIRKGSFGRDLLLGIPTEKARTLDALAKRSKLRVYTGWTWLLERMEEAQSENATGFLLLKDRLYKAEIRRGILEQCSHMSYFVFDGIEGTRMDFLKSSVWILQEKEE